MKERTKKVNELLEGVSGDKLILLTPLIDDYLFLEERIKELKELPFIMVQKSNKAIQKPTAASKQFRELSNTYNMIVKQILNIIGTSEETGTSGALDKWFDMYNRES